MKKASSYASLIGSFLLLIITLSGCKKEKNNSPPASKSSDNIIRSFVLLLHGGEYACTVKDTIRETLPAGTSLTGIVPRITIHEKATVNPRSEVLQNFTNQVKYIVTAEDGSRKEYVVILSVATTTLSAAKKIETFFLNTLNPTVAASIDNTLRKATFRLRPGTDPSALVPTITISPFATITPASGIAQNFTSPVSYQVKAQDGTTNSYTAELLRPAPSSKDGLLAPKYLCIYYDYPSYVNSSGGNVDKAVAEFVKFDLIVFGEGIVKLPRHDDYEKTKQIIQKLKAAKPSIKVYGYIDVGVFAPGQPWIRNYSEDSLKKMIDAWVVAGANGVFGDDFGYDYSVTRSRQNVFIDYAHSKGLSVFANSWSVEDALGGADCHLGATDYYLMESYFVANGSYTSLQANIDKANAAYYYMKTSGVGIATLARASSSVTATSNNSDLYKLSWYATIMYGFDAFQFTDHNHSIGMPPRLYYYQNPALPYGSPWIQFDWVRKVSDTRYERSIGTHTFYITGNGATTGTGGY